MGGVFTCIDEIPDFQRLQYDMTPIKSNPVPIIWLIGPAGSGRTTHGRILSENFEFENIKVAQLLRDEADKETDRGRIIKDGLKNPAKRVPDEIIVDLIKEAMLKKAASTKGFILNGFPRTSKQSALFVKEISDVDVIIYLHADTETLAQRSQEKRGHRVDPEVIKRDIGNYIKEVKESVSKFGSKMEKVHVNVPVGDAYGRIEAVVNIRLNLKSPFEMNNEVVQMTQEL